MLLTLDDVNITLWRPFIWYAAIKFGNLLLKKWYESAWEVHYGTYKGMDYLLRVPSSWNRNTGPRPIVFWHGLGLGICQYKTSLDSFMTLLPDRPLLVPIQPHISQDIFHPRFLTPMGRRETVDCLIGLLEELGWVSERQIDGSDWETDVDEQVAGAVKGVTMLSHSK